MNILRYRKKLVFLKKIIVLKFPAKCNNQGRPIKNLHNAMKLAQNMEKNKVH